MKKGEELYYKLARPDGWDFYTGKTIQYRGDYPHTVRVPSPDKQKGLCSSGVIHASRNPNDCFVGATIPCSAYRVRGLAIIEDSRKCGFFELTILNEITDLDDLFKWKYSETISPYNPLDKRATPTQYDIELLRRWDSVWASVMDSVRASVWASVGASVMDSVMDSVRASVWASVWAYIGSLFPNIKNWKYLSHKPGVYPFQSAVDLWYRNFVPSFDGRIWRLHSGNDASIVYELDKQELTK